ncbi:coatomer subunit gamma [Martiniozyma asiatica (nom. inval.)]|nr:coatomer subunit gamma [Martiniozyma asiatica]
MSTHLYKRGDPAAVPDKMSIYQECLAQFNASPVLAKKSRSLLSKLLRLLYTGDAFPRTESTNLFFSISKLFHNDDASLRQLAYLAIKELTPMADDTLMITASIMKDIQGGQSVYKPNAVRSLSRVLDASTVPAAERLLKNCVVDSNQSVSSAALVSSYHMLPIAKDIVKRWIGETQESISANKQFVNFPESFHENNKAPNSTFINQYHALGLLYQFKNHDKMSLIKMIEQLVERKILTSPIANIQLIRFVNKVINDDSKMIKPLWNLFKSWLSNPSDMVSLEASKLILLNFEKFDDNEQMHAISTLQQLLSVPRSVTRFAAVRILNKVSLRDADKVRVCNLELEKLISDNSRSISTLAITTLLKTGNQENVDRLVETILGFINEISDEFKITVIDAMKILAIKFPNKYKPMLKFLSEALINEGGFEYKNAIVGAILDFVRNIPDSKEIALETLCDYIEDCEYNELSVRILHLLGDEGPQTSNPTEYVRYIYNRVVLENSLVRSAAVIALSKFALIGDKDLSNSIKILLNRCLTDADDEVRDRSALCLKLMDSELDQAKKFIQPERYDLSILEDKLINYVKSNDKSIFENSFNLQDIPLVNSLVENNSNEINNDENENVNVNVSVTDNINDSQILSSITNESKSITSIGDYNKLIDKFQSELQQLPEINSYGNLLHSTYSLDLTEKETEFVVKVNKHIFENHLVLQYSIENTLEDVLLENVSVSIGFNDDSPFDEEFILPIEKLLPNSKSSIYISLSLNDKIYDNISFTNTLTYETKDVDAPDEEGFPDEYQIDDLSINAFDFIKPSSKRFADVWSSLTGSEKSSVYDLGDVSINEVLNKYSLGSVIKRDNGLEMVGKSIWGNDLVVDVTVIEKSGRVLMRWKVKADDEELVDGILESVE